MLVQFFKWSRRLFLEARGGGRKSENEGWRGKNKEETTRTKKNGQQLSRLAQENTGRKYPGHQVIHG